MKLTKTLAKGCVAALITVAALAFSAGANAQTYMGKVEVRSIRGDAFYSTGAGAPMMPLKKDTVLGPGSVIKTGKGGVVDLFLGRTAGRLLLTENTTLSIDKFTITDTGADTVLDLQVNLPEGTVVGNVDKLAAASKYEVKVPNGVAGIRGTTFRISSTGFIVVPSGTVIFVYVPPGGQPTPYTLLAPPGVYFSPVEGVKPAPEELLHELRTQSGPTGLRPGPPDAIPFRETFVAPINVIPRDVRPEPPISQSEP